MFSGLAQLMTEAENIAGVIQKALPNIKPGSLRFWGSWFGKPYDNRHQMVGCDFNGDMLEVRFDESELLKVWEPRRATVNEKSFRIVEAKRVRWVWFYYGRPKLPASLYFQEFVREDTQITVETNIDWYTPTYASDPSFPAVEIL